MNSRQLLLNRSDKLEVLYKPGFIDDTTLEAVKMSVDKELGLISNCFYNASEVISTKTTDVTPSVSSLVEKVQELQNIIQNLEERVSILEGV